MFYVEEEMHRVLVLGPHNLERPSQMQIASSGELPLYRLIFNNALHTPLYINTKILDLVDKPLQIVLVQDPSNSPFSYPSPINIELVVLHGDFPCRDDWTREDFQNAIVKARPGRDPLLRGDVSNITMKDGVAMIEDLVFMDDSSWTRNHHFRIGARVVPGSKHQTIIKETFTEKFIVKDHRHTAMSESSVKRLKKKAMSESSGVVVATD